MANPQKVFVRDLDADDGSADCCASRESPPRHSQEPVEETKGDAPAASAPEVDPATCADWLFAHPGFGSTGLEDATFSRETVAADEARAKAGTLTVVDGGSRTLEEYRRRPDVKRELQKAESDISEAEKVKGKSETPSVTATPDAGPRFICSCRSQMLASSESRKAKRLISTSLSCPSRWMRPAACTSIAGSKLGFNT